MDRKFFNKQMVVLLTAYRISEKFPEEAEDVYWEMLKDIPEREFASGVKKCLETLKFFPTIAELGDASLPPITDMRAPLPAVDHERPTINWRTQLNRAESERQAKLQKMTDRKRIQ